jgi:hypothetical protein
MHNLVAGTQSFGLAIDVTMRSRSIEGLRVARLLSMVVPNWYRSCAKQNFEGSQSDLGRLLKYARPIGWVGRGGFWRALQFKRVSNLNYISLFHVLLQYLLTVECLSWYSSTLYLTSRYLFYDALPWLYLASCILALCQNHCFGNYVIAC